MGYPPLPAQSSHFCQYADFLVHSLKATSIPNYLNIIGILHKEFNLPYPLLGNWPLQYLLERFSLDCRKTKTKVNTLNTLANQRT